MKKLKETKHIFPPLGANRSTHIEYRENLTKKVKTERYYNQRLILRLLPSLPILLASKLPALG